MIAIAAGGAAELVELRQSLREPGPATAGAAGPAHARCTRAAAATFRARLPWPAIESCGWSPRSFVFLAVNVVFYSSFFTHWPGAVIDAVRVVSRFGPKHRH